MLSQKDIKCTQDGLLLRNKSKWVCQKPVSQWFLVAVSPCYNLPWKSRNNSIGDSAIFLTNLSPPVKYIFTDLSKAVLLLWIIYVMSVLFCYAFMHVCLFMPCDTLQERGWPLGSHLWCRIVTLSLSHWYPGSGVVLDCIDPWSLPSVLLLH